VRQRPDSQTRNMLQWQFRPSMEIRMYIGGILGTIIVIALIVWFLRRV